MDSMGFQTIGRALTTPERAFVGIREALEIVANEINTTLEAMLAAAGLVIYGTTRATNAIVMRDVAETALLTTQGFPDAVVFKEGDRTMHMIPAETFRSRIYRGVVPSKSRSG